jgi:hypothetical protein
MAIVPTKMALFDSWWMLTTMGDVIGGMQITDTDHIDRLMSCLNMALPFYAVSFFNPNIFPVHR